MGNLTVARLVKPRQGLLGWRWAARPKVKQGDYAVFHCINYDDCVRAHRVNSLLPAASEGGVLIELRSGVFAVNLTSRALLTSDGFKVDVTLHCVVRILKPEKFIEANGCVWLHSAGGIVDANSVADYLMRMIETVVAVKLCAVKYEDLRRIFYPISEDFLLLMQRAVAPYFTFETVQLASLNSEAGDAIFAERARLLERQRQIALAKVETDLVTSQLEIETQSAIRAAELETQRIRARRKADREKHRSEIEKLKSEIASAFLQRDVSEGRQKLEEFLDIFEYTFSDGVANASRIAAFQSGISANVVDQINKSRVLEFKPNSMLIAISAEKAKRAPGIITLERSNLTSRDLIMRATGGSVRLEQAVMEEPLAFNVKVKRNGFLTLIVNASSGRTQLVAPNAYSDACHCFCFDGEDVPFPGKLLLNTIHDFKILQDGPRGWEELIAILSDEPLVENRDLEEAFTSYGFLYLDEEKIQRYTSKLTNWTDESWGAGVLGYRVVER